MNLLFPHHAIVMDRFGAQNYILTIKSTTEFVAVKSIRGTRTYLADGQTPVVIPDQAGITIWSCDKNAHLDTDGDPVAEGSIEVFGCRKNILTRLELWMPGINRLKTLDCSRNLLKTLTFYACPPNKDAGDSAPLSIDCSRNRLAELDLTSVDNVHMLNCENNSLVSLKLGSQPGLRLLKCRHNSLRTIDVSALSRRVLINADDDVLVEAGSLSCSSA